MTVQRISAFSTGDVGGNPAGVVIAPNLPPTAQMQATAGDIGYSETVFAAPEGDDWIVRYYSPQAEVAFCGHATVALGVALGQLYGAGRFDLNLANGRISVTATQTDHEWTAELLSPATWSEPLAADLTASSLSLFGLTKDDLDPRLAPTLAFAGVRHAVLPLLDRKTLAGMSYDFDSGRRLMEQYGLTTISLIHIEDESTFVARNAFAIGGVVEDPATGAAAAALGGALVDLDWPGVRGGGTFTIRQGEDMGQPSLIHVRVSGKSGDSVAVKGAARQMV